ncbi:periplasmic folding chaperone [Paracoccaceae bacterium]
MTKTAEEETRRPKRKVTEVAVWLLMAMLILGLGGFGVTSFSGEVTEVGRVGSAVISADAYARTFQNQVRTVSEQFGQQLSTQDALAFGLDRQVLQDLAASAAMDNEATSVGLSVGDAVVATKLISMDAFKGVSGSFDREVYTFQLDRLNQSSAEFENGLRGDVTRDLLRGMIASGITAPDMMTGKLYDWIGERRGVSLLRLTEADLIQPLPAPTDDELNAYHTANIALFTKPEAKRITYVSLLPDAIAKDQPVDETLLREVYDDRIDEFVSPERRVVERLVYPDQAAADAARSKLDGGAAFEELVADRGLTLDAIDLGDVAKDDLGAAGDAVFALAEGGVAGPVATDLGPALFRVPVIIAAEETTFDAARDALALELQFEAAQKVIADSVETVDDLLASGASLEDLVTDAGLTLATLDFVPGVQGDAAVEGYAAFRDAATAVAEGDFSEAIVLEDGGVVALRLDEIVPAAPIPFDEARDAVTEAWRKDALQKALVARAAEIKTAVEGGAAFGSFGIIDAAPKLARNGVIEGTPDGLVADVFAMDEAGVKVIEAAGFVGVLRVDSIQAATTTGEEAEAERAYLASELARAISTDVFAAYTAALTLEAGITIDQSAINAIHASLP